MIEVQAWLSLACKPFGKCPVTCTSACRSAGCVVVAACVYKPAFGATFVSFTFAHVNN